MGPVATSDLYDRLLRACQRKYSAVQDDDYPEIFIASVPFEGSDENGVADEKRLQTQCLEAVRTLDEAGADRILIPCVTLHAFLAAIDAETDAEVINLLEQTGQQIKSDGSRTVGLLASETSYNHGLFRQNTEDIRFLTPNRERRAQLTEIIRNVMGGQLRAEDKETIQQIANGLEWRGAKGIVLGCTELPVLVDSADLSQTVYDTTQILSRTAITNTRLGCNRGPR